MARELPKYVHLRGRPGGVRFLYFERKGHREKIEEEYGTPEFWARYAALLAGPVRISPKSRTWSKLIDSYYQSPNFSRRAARTKLDYKRHMEKLRKVYGDDDPARMQRKHVIRLRDKNAKKPRLANYLVQCLSILFEHAIDKGWMPEDRNPAKGVSLVDMGESFREPWPDALVAKFRAEVPIGTRARLIFELALGTAQRMGDVLKMRWNEIGPDGIAVSQNKTRKRLVIPLTPHLEAALRVTPRDGLFIVSGEHGKPLSYRQAAFAMKKARDAAGAGKEHDSHALRYTASVEIRRLGVSVEHISSITGMSRKTVEHYTRHLDQINMAKEVQSLRK